MTISFLDLAAERGVTFPLHTRRLTLTPFMPEDAEILYRWRYLPEVELWIEARPASVDVLCNTLLDQRNTLVLRFGGDVVGEVHANINNGWAQDDVRDVARDSQAELGWILDPRYHHRGYATEAVQELLRLCFVDLGLRRVTAGLYADNEASWRLMERVGMRREAVFRKESFHRDFGWVDGMTYGLLAEEWHAAH